MTPIPSPYLANTNSDEMFGTLAFIGTIENTSYDSDLVHVALTVGHVLDPVDAAGVTLFSGESSHQVQPIEGHERFLGKPKFRVRFPGARKELDEICFLNVDSVGPIECLSLPNVNCNVWYPVPEYYTEADRVYLPALLEDPSPIIDCINDLLPLSVLEYGASSGLTKGSVVHVEKLSNNEGQKSTIDEVDSARNIDECKVFT